MRLLSLLIILLGLAAKAQISVYPLPIDKSMSITTDKDKKGVFRAQKVKDKITGSGIYKFKNGAYYIGDFKEKAFHGLAMLIPAEGEEIANCPGARVYVGRFKNGLKNGNGVCYDASGNVIYSGKFENDAPISPYPNAEESVKFFADIQSPDLYYIGEFEGEEPNGFGALFFKEGDFLISLFENGNRKGTSVYFQKDGNWFSEKVDGDEVTPISSSEEYSAIESRNKAITRAALSQAFSLLGEAFLTGAQLASQIQNINSPSAGVSYDMGSSSYSDNSSGSSGSRGSSSVSSGDKYDVNEQRSYNRDKSTYNKYDSMLSQVFAGNRKATASEINEWQRKMTELRTKWESRGKSFPHSSNESR